MIRDQYRIMATPEGRPVVWRFLPNSLASERKDRVSEQGRHVIATREGLLGGVTASGYRIDRVVPFVALPSFLALGRFLWIANPQTDCITYAIVLDTGPWNTDDHAYVFEGARPQAETLVDTRGRRTNGAGIDLGERVWRELRMVDNGPVVWGFLPNPLELKMGSAFERGPASTASNAAPPAAPEPDHRPAVDHATVAAAGADIRG